MRSELGLVERFSEVYMVGVIRHYVGLSVMRGELKWMCVVHTARPISHIPVLPRSVQRSGNKDIGDKSRLDNSETNLRCFA